jgi:uncharacterized protein (DUF305 family)
MILRPEPFPYPGKSISLRGLMACLAVVAMAAFVAGAAIHSQPATISPFTICSTATQVEFPGETSYLAENDTAMNKMMSAMVIKPTGDADRDFVAMMSPHHQGAIEMAQAVLRNGHNEQIRRLAQEIIVTQQQEIAAMRLAIGEPLPPSVPSPTQLAGSTVRP